MKRLLLFIAAGLLLSCTPKTSVTSPDGSIKLQFGNAGRFSRESPSSPSSPTSTSSPTLSGISSTDLAFLVDKLPFLAICPRKCGVLVDKLGFYRVCPPIWRFWWTKVALACYLRGKTEKRTIMKKIMLLMAALTVSGSLMGSGESMLRSAVMESGPVYFSIAVLPCWKLVAK